jgi:hypothetical protein
MPIVFPLARLAFEPEPVCGIVPDGAAPAFLEEIGSLIFAAEPVVTFDFAPFNVEIVPTDSAALVDEDTGAILVDEDNGQVLIAEEST